MSETKPEASKDYIILGIITAAGVMFAIAFANAFVIKTLWNWFLTDLAPSINLSTALGICLIAGTLKYRSRTPEERARDVEHLWDSLLQWLQTCVLTLAFGWLCLKLLA